MSDTRARDEFVKKYATYAEKYVDTFVRRKPEYVKQLRGDMLSEAYLRLVKVADKFFFDDEGESIYVRNYAYLAVRAACSDVLRSVVNIAGGRGSSTRATRASEDLHCSSGSMPRHTVDKISGKKRDAIPQICVYIDCSNYAAVQIESQAAREPLPDDLQGQVGDKRVIDWSQHFSGENLEAVESLIESYRTQTTREDRAAHVRRLRKIKPLIQEIVHGS